MPLQTINIGASANDGTGDPLRTAFDTPTVSPLIIPLLYCHINGFQ
jgi:hypothetical protein